MKLKPFPTQASLTSLQFRALKSALAAMDSTEKVQMIVCSVGIVHFCENPYCLRLSAVSRLPVKLPCSRTYLNDRAFNGCNSTVTVYQHISPKQNRLLLQPRMVKSPRAPQKRGLRVRRCHMNPGSAAPGVLTQLRWADEAPGRCVEMEMLCVEGSAPCLDLMHWQGKAGHKIWSGIQPYPPQRGLQVDTYHRDT